MISDYGHLLDPEAPTDAAPILRIPDKTSPEEVVGALDQLITDHPDDDVVVLSVGGRKIGATSRHLLATRYGTPSTVRQGESERAGLGGAGGSTRYDILTLHCEQCHARAYQVFYEEYSRPRCHVDRGHGLMTLE